MGSIKIKYFASPYGELILGAYNSKLCLCDWRYRKNRGAVDARIQRGLKAEYLEHDDPVLEKAQQQLNEYFNQERKVFEIPLLMVGTPFQKSVWKYLLKIPFGQTASYLELARAIGNKKAFRAVARANGANAHSIIIPCHRIIGSSRKLVGYAGGNETKAKLLGLEFELFN